MIVGCAIVYSASRTKQADSYLYATRQVIFLIGSIVAMALVMAVDYEWFRTRSRVVYAATLVALVFVFLAGTVSNGAVLGFAVGPLKLQPAEFAKVTVWLALAAFLTRERSSEMTYPRFAGAIVIVGVPAVLIVLQPDVGSTSVIIGLGMGVLLVAGAKVRYIALITALTVVTMVAAVGTGVVKRYQFLRIQAFLAPGSKDVAIQAVLYQPRNAQIAIATGGVMGKGWLKGPVTNATNDIPVQWADFPMSAVGEQFGFVGCSVILLLFLVLLWRIWRIAHLSRDMFGTFICAGAVSMMAWQIFQNVGMTIGLMPVTGVPLPFISYGGSSLAAYCLLLGLIQSVHMRRFRSAGVTSEQRFPTRDTAPLGM